LPPTWEQPFTFASQMEQVFFSNSTKEVVIIYSAKFRKVVNQNVEAKPMEPMTTMKEVNGPRHYAIERVDEGQSSTLNVPTLDEEEGDLQNLMLFQSNVI
jgi:F0F1-type ATP synthase gamma subunit